MPRPTRAKAAAAAAPAPVPAPAPTKKPTANAKAKLVSRTAVEAKESLVSRPKRAASPTAQPAKKRLRTAAPALNAAPTAKLDILVFGAGEFGELGLGAKPINDQKPTNVRYPRHNVLLDALGVAQIAVGGMHCIALGVDGDVVTWGVNDHGALGRDTAWEAPMKEADAESDSDDDDDVDLNPKESTPGKIPASDFGGEHVFVQVSAANSASFALTKEGDVFGWGTFSGNEGTMGFVPKGAMHAAKTKSDKEKFQLRPMAIPHLKKITRLATGSNHVLALDHKGKVFAWGAAGQSQLGLRIMTRNYAFLDPHELMQKVKYIACGAYHSFAISTDGLVYAWGLNNFGQTGISEGAGEENAIVLQPTVVESLRPYNIKAIEGGEHHSIACTEDGQLLVWGRCDDGQMGIDLKKVPKEDIVLDSRERPRILLKPTVVESVKGAVAVAAGIDTSFAVTGDGAAWAWGYSDGHRTGLGTTDPVVEATQMKSKAVAARKITWAGAGGQFGLLASVTEAK